MENRRLREQRATGPKHLQHKARVEKFYSQNMILKNLQFDQKIENYVNNRKVVKNRKFS